LIDEAGVDAVRYYFVSKAGDTHMDLDLDMANSKTNDNPVYYAQYAHATYVFYLKTSRFDRLFDNFDLITFMKKKLIY
jgi:arginyl-tRNA synthetase